MTSYTWACRLWRRAAPAAGDSRRHAGKHQKSETRVRLDAHERVIRIEVVDVLARDDLMLDEHGRRDRPFSQDVDRQGEEAAAVFLGKVPHRRDEGGARLPELGTSVRFGILANDGTAVGASGFLERACGAERARVVGGANENPLGLRLA
jgi:hypothetical protein